MSDDIQVCEWQVFKHTYYVKWLHVLTNKFIDELFSLSESWAPVLSWLIPPSWKQVFYITEM